MTPMLISTPGIGNFC